MIKDAPIVESWFLMLNGSPAEAGSTVILRPKVAALNKC
jgi:hypothetical protein